MKEYENSLSKEQKLAIKEERQRKQEHDETLKINRERKGQLKSLGKPKSPLSPFFVYYSEQSKKSSKPLKSTTAKEQWDKLNDQQRRPFVEKSAASREVYKYASN